MADDMVMGVWYMIWQGCMIDDMAGAVWLMR